MDKDWERAYTVPISIEKSEAASVGAEGASSSQNLYSSFGNTSPPDPDQQSLRHTVNIAEQIQKDDAQKLESQPKRSSSAPPTSSSEGNKEPKRYTTKIEITPVNPFEPKSDMSSNKNGVASSTSDDARPSTSPCQVPFSADQGPCYQNPIESAQPTADDSPARNGSFGTVADQSRTGECQPLQTNRNQPQVRHIPIFVEGRAEPVIPVNEAELLEQKLFTTDQAPLKRKLDGSSANGIASTEMSAPFEQNQVPSQERKIPVETPVTSATVSPSASTPFPEPPSPPAAQVAKPDSQQRVDQVQQEVDIITRRVEQYNGSSRNDKEYLYLDEMLTRNLIALDTIEVEGNEQLRTARKNVIKSIQKSIALLESKIPLPVNENKSTDDSSDQIGELPPTSDSSSTNCGTLMEVDSNKIAGDENDVKNV